jgi:CheY-like chemotaxis protein
MCGMNPDAAAETRPTVLVVDDDPDTVYVYTHVLGSYGCRVVVCRDGAAAVSAAREARPDVILMDFLLPGMNGWEATAALKAEADTAGIPVIGISAYGDPEARASAMRAGCSDFFEKPVSPMLVLTAVRALVGPTHAPAVPADAGALSPR